MSQGKAAARDLRYGRRGGSWAEGDAVGIALNDIARAREKGLADGSWPSGTRAGLCEFCGRTPEAHVGDDLELERAGRARMADARRFAGVPLDDLDRRVLTEADA